VFKDVAHEYVFTATVPAQVRHLIDRAVRIAYDQRTVTCIIFPNDVQRLEAVETPPREHGTVHSGIGQTIPMRVPVQEDLERAADILNSGKKVAILAGAGALHATDELVEVAEITGAGIAKALLGKAAVPDDLPFVTGAIGLLGTKPSWDLMNECDTLLVVGSAFPYAEFLPEEGRARGIQIDLDGRMLGLRYPMELNLIGDSRETLRALLPLLLRKDARAWRKRIEENVARWWRVLHTRAMIAAQPVNPQRVFWELSERLPYDAIVAADSGSSTNWYARDLKLRRGMMASLSGGLATMGCAVPYALAAKLAYPHRPVFALLGDGAMLMNGINGLVTIAERWKAWRDPRLIVMVLNNRDLNEVTWEQRILEGDPKFSASQDVPDFPYAEYARSLGLGGTRVDDPEAVGPAWDDALAADRPVVLEMVTDPNVPPLPPHVTLPQVRNYLGALLRRDADAAAIVKATVKEWWAGTFPERSEH
jgi:pyruvate dehydrogenase (quinone)